MHLRRGRDRRRPQRAGRGRASRHQGLEGRRGRARRRRRRRGQDPRTHAARLSPRPLRDESRACSPGSPFFAAHKERLLAHGLGFVAAEHCFASAFPDGTLARRRHGPRGDRGRIAALTRPTRSAGGQWSRRSREDAPHIFALLGSPMPSWQALRDGLWRLAGARRGTGSPTPRACCSPRRASGSTRNFENDKVKAMMAAWGMHLDFAPDIAGGALFPYLESMANQSFGMVIGQGGADTIIAAMSARDRSGGRRSTARRAGAKASTIEGGAARPSCSPTASASRRGAR